VLLRIGAKRYPPPQWTRGTSSSGYRVTCMYWITSRYPQKRSKSTQPKRPQRLQHIRRRHTLSVFSITLGRPTSVCDSYCRSSPSRKTRSPRLPQCSVRGSANTANSTDTTKTSSFLDDNTNADARPRSCSSRPSKIAPRYSEHGSTVIRSRHSPNLPWRKHHG
jgi:hypothetical protein